MADAADALTVIRVTRGTGFRVQAPAGGLTNAANGAAPFGLAATAGRGRSRRASRRPSRTTSRPATSASGSRSPTPTSSSPFAADEPSFRSIARTNAVEVSAVINRQLVAADVPVRASSRQYAGGTNDAIRLSSLRARRASPSRGTAGLLGLNTAAATNQRTTPIASRGPWNLTPPGAGPRQLEIHATSTRRDPSRPADARVREPGGRQRRGDQGRDQPAARQQGGLTTLVAEPLVVALSVRRSSTEGVGARAVTGGFAVADLVGSKDAIAAADRPARFRVPSPRRTPTGSRRARRTSSTSAWRTSAPCASTPARVRLFELTVPAAPGAVTRSEPAFGSVDQPLAPGESAIVEVPFDLDARPSGSRVFILAVADLAAAALDPPASLPSLDEWHRFCLEHPSAAIRELVVA